MGPDRAQDMHLFALSTVQIPAKLQIHPQVGRGVKEFRQAQGGAGSDTAPAIDNLVDANAMLPLAIT